MLDELGSVRNHEHRAARRESPDRLRYDVHAPRVQIGGGLIEDDERSIPEECAGQTDPPALAR